MTTIPTSTKQLPSAIAIVETLSKPLEVVVGWQEIELPSRWAVGTWDVRKLTIRVRDQPINFMATIQQSLVTAKHGQGLCETGLKASEMLLGRKYLDHSEQEKSQFMTIRINEIQRSASALNDHTNGIKKRFRNLRIGVFEIHEELNTFMVKPEQGTISALLSRFGKDVKKWEAELAEVLNKLEEIENALNLITGWWERVEAYATYLQVSGESTLVVEQNRIHLRELEDGFTRLRDYFADYVQKISVLWDQKFAKLYQRSRKRLRKLLKDTDFLAETE